jgi:hypothetical protein
MKKFNCFVLALVGLLALGLVFVGCGAFGPVTVTEYGPDGKIIKKATYQNKAKATPAAKQGNPAPRPVAPRAAPAQVSTGVDNLDPAIRAASDYLNTKIPQGSKVAIINISSSSPAVSSYIIDGLIANAVNDQKFNVVDRAKLNEIQKEQNFQTSGEVDDNTAQAIGKLLAAQTIISGSANRYGSIYRISIRALSVETAQVQGQFNKNISANGSIITSLATSTGGSSGAADYNATGDNGSAAPAVASGTYKVGDTGPGGGIIFYDKGSKTNGWQYLEAAPEDLDGKIAWCAGNLKRVDGTNTGLGSGKKNTQLIVNAFTNDGLSGAATACDDYTLNGLDDWFLPSAAELALMYRTLKEKGLGNFQSENYWTSTYDFGSYAYRISFGDGQRVSTWENQAYLVRPIREF